MMKLQPQIALLDAFVVQHESIPSIKTDGSSQVKESDAYKLEDRVQLHTSFENDRSRGMNNPHILDEKYKYEAAEDAFDINPNRDQTLFDGSRNATNDKGATCKGHYDFAYFSFDPSVKIDIIRGIDSGYSSFPPSLELESTTSTDIRKYNFLRTNSIGNIISPVLSRISENDTNSAQKQLDLQSICSNETSVLSIDLAENHDKYYPASNEEYKKRCEKVVPHKLEVKIRYLLQIFTEANCLEYSLVLSILLLDAASVSRITNTVIRSGSLQGCRQIRNGLKDITRWSFHECFGYRAFMMKLQPQIALLDAFVVQHESIPSIKTDGSSQVKESDAYKLEDRVQLHTSFKNDRSRGMNNPTHILDEKYKYEAAEEAFDINPNRDQTLFDGSRNATNDKGATCILM